jgi:hypothetical protein
MMKERAASEVRAGRFREMRARRFKAESCNASFFILSFVRVLHFELRPPVSNRTLSAG